MRKQFYAVSSCALILASCTTTDTDNVAQRQDTPTKQSDSYGQITESGVVVNLTPETLIPRDEFIGEDCVKHLRKSKGLVRKIQDKACNPHNARYNYYAQQYCIQKQQRAQKDRQCHGKLNAFKAQSIYLRPYEAVTTNTQAAILGQARFFGGAESTTIAFRPHTGLSRDSKYVLVNDFNKPIPVRGKGSGDRFCIKAPHFGEQSTRAEAYAHKKNLEDEIAKIEAKRTPARRRFRNSEAQDNGQCVKPKQAAYPPRPNGISTEEVQFQANGGCVDLITRRFSPYDALNAFTRLSMDNNVRQWKRWQAEPAKQSSCGKNLITQFDTAVTDIACSFGGDWGKKHLLPACIQKLYGQCMALAQRTCASPVQAWQDEIRRIQEGPSKALKACQDASDEVTALTARYINMRAQLKIVTQKIERMEASRTPVQRVDLAAATCTQ